MSVISNWQLKITIWFLQIWSFFIYLQCNKFISYHNYIWRLATTSSLLVFLMSNKVDQEHNSHEKRVELYDAKLHFLD